jgi:hypothetical protein
MWNRSIVVLSVVLAASVACPLSAQAYMAPDSFFDVFLESASSPPVPSSATRTWVRNQLTEGGPVVTTAEIDLSLGSASAGMGATTLLMSDAIPNTKANGDLQPTLCAPDSFFDIFLECFSASHGNLSIIGTPVLSYMAPDSFFDVFLECVGPIGGTTQTLNLHCQPSEGILISGVAVSNLNNALGSFDLVGQIRAQDGYTFTPGSSAMTMTLTGGMVPEPSTLILLAVGGLALAMRRRHRR